MRMLSLLSITNTYIHTAWETQPLIKTHYSLCWHGHSSQLGKLYKILWKMNEKCLCLWRGRGFNTDTESKISHFPSYNILNTTLMLIHYFAQKHNAPSVWNYSKEQSKSPQCDSEKLLLLLQPFVGWFVADVHRFCQATVQTWGRNHGQPYRRSVGEFSSWCKSCL